MTEVISLPADSFDSQQDSAGKDNQDKSPALVDDKQSAAEEAKQSGSPPPPLPPDTRRRERDSREKRDERDFARLPNRQGGDHYDRNRMPPPPPRDRDRDYKRRLSPSPPPHRDRRPSSPSRRSPPYPSYKRSRRDDGYDGRRGSPRGYGNERRFRYDHTRAHDHEMGFRPGYGDDRFYGRFSGGYPGGPDWDSGHDGSKAMSRSAIPREGLMSYKQFIQELEDDVLPSEAERRYEEYKSGYITAQKRTYFEAHKDEEWLRNKYHPTNLVSVVERRNEHARNVAKGFLLDLHSGELDLGPNANSASKDKSEQINNPNFENEVEGGAKRRHHGYSKESETFAAPMAPSVSSDAKRIKIDIEFALSLVSKLDSEKGIGENILSRPDNEKMSRDKPHGGSVGPVVIVRGSTSVKGLEGVELLDTLLTYLWRVHGVDYYGMIEVAEPKGLKHVRPEGKSSSGTSSSADEWQQKLDTYWQERLRNQDPLEIMTAKEKIDAAAVEGLDPYVRKIRDEKYGWKYGCGAKGCTKLFHGPEFVQKHLKLKHADLVMELTSKVREDLYFQNYMNDPKAPGGQPVMQQAVKEKPPRRSPFDGRLKDDRGILRDRDGRGNFSERIDRSENTLDFPGKIDDQKKGIKADDEPMFDNFGGPGVCIPPFAPDVPPPPVMVPVPGAGPLGPFIPAPPEVAMRMMREQGGAPSTFEGAGRKGPLIAGGHGGPPIILPPNYKPDPRRLRSYNDLDAPEDEVTVIDYRSI